MMLRLRLTLVLVTALGLTACNSEDADDSAFEGPLPDVLVYAPTDGTPGQKKSRDNLHQFNMSMLHFDSNTGSLPRPAIRSKDGKDLLSWRVTLLPYLGHEDLYKRFHLDESWDSEHNKQLLSEMPDVFRAPGSKAGEGKTCYVLPIHKLGVFPPGNEKPLHMALAVSKVLILEADDEHAVNWTEPKDLEFKIESPWEGLRVRSGFVLAAFGQGNISHVGRGYPDLAWVAEVLQPPPPQQPSEPDVTVQPPDADPMPRK